jgi:hypothetical protein
MLTFFKFGLKNSHTNNKTIIINISLIFTAAITQFYLKKQTITKMVFIAFIYDFDRKI